MVPNYIYLLLKKIRSFYITFICIKIVIASQAHCFNFILQDKFPFNNSTNAIRTFTVVQTTVNCYVLNDLYIVLKVDTKIVQIIIGQYYPIYTLIRLYQKTYRKSCNFVRTSYKRKLFWHSA